MQYVDAHYHYKQPRYFSTGSRRNIVKPSSVITSTLKPTWLCFLGERWCSNAHTQYHYKQPHYYFSVGTRRSIIKPSSVNAWTMDPKWFGSGVTDSAMMFTMDAITNRLTLFPFLPSSVITLSWLCFLGNKWHRNPYTRYHYKQPHYFPHWHKKGRGKTFRQYVNTKLHVITFPR